MKENKKLEWIDSGRVIFTDSIKTEQITMNATLLNEMFKNEKKDALDAFKVQNIDDYKMFITKYSLRLNGVDIPNEIIE